MPDHYEIIVQGRFDPAWSAWFAGMALTAIEEDATLLTGQLLDQAALHGLLESIRDLNLTLVSVKKVDAGISRDPTEGEYPNGS